MSNINETMHMVNQTYAETRAQFNELAIKAMRAYYEIDEEEFDVNVISLSVVIGVYSDASLMWISRVVYKGGKLMYQPSCATETLREFGLAELVMLLNSMMHYSHLYASDRYLTAKERADMVRMRFSRIKRENNGNNETNNN